MLDQLEADAVLQNQNLQEFLSELDSILTLGYIKSDVWGHLEDQKATPFKPHMAPYIEPSKPNSGNWTPPKKPEFIKPQFKASPFPEAKPDADHSRLAQLEKRHTIVTLIFIAVAVLIVCGIASTALE